MSRPIRRWVICFLTMVISVSAAAGQSEEDFRRAVGAVAKIEEAIKELRESGLSPEAEPFQQEAGLLREKLVRMQAQLKRKRASKRLFGRDDIEAGIVEIRARIRANNERALEEMKLPSEREERRLDRLHKELMGHQDAIFQHFDLHQGQTVSASMRRKETARKLERARAAGKSKSIAELEFELRVYDKLLVRLEHDAIRLLTVEVSPDLASFLRKLRKERAKAERSNDR